MTLRTWQLSDHETNAAAAAPAVDLAAPSQTVLDAASHSISADPSRLANHTPIRMVRPRMLVIFTGTMGNQLLTAWIASTAPGGSTLHLDLIDTPC